MDFQLSDKVYLPGEIVSMHGDGTAYIKLNDGQSVYTNLGNAEKAIVATAEKPAKTTKPKA